MMEVSNTEKSDLPKGSTIQIHNQAGDNIDNIQIKEQRGEDIKEGEVKKESQEYSMTVEKQQYTIEQQKKLTNVQDHDDEKLMLHGNQNVQENKPIFKEIGANTEMLKRGKGIFQGEAYPEKESKGSHQTPAKNKDQANKEVPQQNIKHQQQQKQSKKDKSSVSENQERVNYLVQVSKFLAIMPPTHKSNPSNYDCADQALASQTGALATAIGRRCVMRLSPALKRSLCKGCGVTLVYGVNARVRHRSRREKHMVVTCLACRTIKRFVNDPKHKLWCEQEEAIL